jgi:hypothetical protein
MTKISNNNFLRNHYEGLNLYKILMIVIPIKSIPDQTKLKSTYCIELHVSAYFRTSFNPYRTNVENRVSS